MLKFSRICAVFCCFFALSSNLWAEQAEPEAFGDAVTAESPVHPLSLPEVVVTANRLDVPVSEVAASMSVITAKELEQKQAGTVLEALQGLPGLDIVRAGGAGEICSIYTRGSRTADTLVMVDGIPLNDPVSPARSYDYLDQLSVDGIGQIEVLRGPQSTLYGSNAMGGVVNLLTRGGEGPLGASLLFEGGAYHTFRETASLGLGSEKGNLSLSLTHFDTAGYSTADKEMGNIQNNPDQSTTGYLKAGGTILPGFQSDVLFRYSQSHTNPDDGAGPGMDDPNFFADQKQFLAGSRSKLELFDGVWEQVLGFSFSDNNRTYTDDPNAAYPYAFYYRGNYDGQTAQANWQNNLRLEKNETLVLGLQGIQEWGNSSADFGYGPVTSVATARTGSLYVESRTALGGRLFETLGGRVDFHSQFGTHSTYQAGLAYFIPVLETKLKATYGTGFLAPSLYQLYDPSFGNLSLQPENSTGFDAGFEQPLWDDFVRVGATYFHQDYNSLIDFVSTGFFTGQYFNVGQAQSDGVEAFADLKGVRNLEMRLDYTSTHAWDAATGLPLIQVPQDKLSLETYYRQNAVEWGISFVVVGPRPDLNFSTYPATRVTMDSYRLVNLRAAWQIDPRVKLFARVDNLLNQTYEETWGYGTPGLSAYLGVKLSYQ